MNKKLIQRKGLYAFTIMEMIVTMIISSIVISLAIGLYLNFQKTFYDFLGVSNQYNDALTFLSWMKTDIEKCESIDNTGNTIFLYNADNKEIIYYIDNKEVIRKSFFKTDTFLVAVTDFSVTTLNAENKLVGKINLSLKIDDFETTVVLKKEYANAVLFEIDKNEH